MVISFQEHLSGMPRNSRSRGTISLHLPPAWTSLCTGPSRCVGPQQCPGSCQGCWAQQEQSVSCDTSAVIPQLKPWLCSPALGWGWLLETTLSLSSGAVH